MAKRKKETIQIPTKRCLHCGLELGYQKFYQLHNRSNIYSGNENYLPVCKNCLKILYEQFKIKYVNQFSVLGMNPEELKGYEPEKLAVRRLCMVFDIYYSDKLFDTALKQIERFPTLDMVSAYMKIANLKQNKNKDYDNTICEENLSQELLKSAMVDKVREQFENNEVYRDIYNLCIKLLQSLKRNCNIENLNIKNHDYSTMENEDYFYSPSMANN